LAGSAYKAVIFDFGGVLCFPPTENQFADAAARVGLSTAAFVESFWHDRLEYDRGEDAKLYWQKVASHAGRTLDPLTIEEMIAREIDFWSHFDQRLFDWTRVLRNQGIRTGILSNLPRPLGEHLKTLPHFLNHFDRVTFSYELNLVKPQAGIYQHCLNGLGLEGLGLQPGEALFLDDRPENVDGARAVGLEAHLFTTWEEFLQANEARYRLPVTRM